ncbi:MAG: hypothetical protein M1423_07810 [Acidobacteria bacterium]|nr:hypothetical protein [Acidobacteriota bacterium]
MIKRLSLVFSVFLLAGAMEAASAQDFSEPPPVSPREFALMAWGGTPSDPSHSWPSTWGSTEPACLPDE